MVTRELRTAEWRRRLPPLMLVAIGGAVGSLARHSAVANSGDSELAVLALNVTGSLLLGGLTAWASHHRDRSDRPSMVVDRWTALIGLGFCGGLTTFSTHVFDVAASFDAGEWGRGLASLVATATLAIVAAVVGHTIAERRIEPQPGGARS